jgi:hypothetical protein
MAAILGDLGIVFVKFDPDKITAEFQCNLSGTATTAKWIENYSSTDCWEIGFPCYSQRLPRDVLPPGTTLKKNLVISSCEYVTGG